MGGALPFPQFNTVYYTMPLGPINDAQGGVTFPPHDLYTDHARTDPIYTRSLCMAIHPQHHGPVYRHSLSYPLHRVGILEQRELAGVVHRALHGGHGG